MAFGLFGRCDPNNREKPPLFPGPGDASAAPPFRTCPEAMASFTAAVNSFQANSYAPSAGSENAKRAVADYLNKNLEEEVDKVVPDNVIITAGCNQAIEIIVEALANPNNPEANILIPRPGYPHYHGRAICSRLNVRKYDLVPGNGWEIDLDALERMADHNTVAMVLINPNNPCGNVYTNDHLKQVAEMAKKLGIMVISDEVYEHIVYGERPFVPMRKFASIAPVITLGSISKGWLVPGWRVGWMAMNDPEGELKNSRVVRAIKNCLDLSTQPSLPIQEALHDIFEKTPESFFTDKINAMKVIVEFSCEKLRDIPCLVCHTKPESCSYLWVELDKTKLRDITDDVDFCTKLATDENLVLTPGSILGQANWVRITIATSRLALEDIFNRLKRFCDSKAA